MEQQPTQTKLLTYQEVADFYRVHYRTVQRMVTLGFLRPHYVGRGGVRFPDHEVKAMRRSRQATRDARRLSRGKK